MSVGDNMDKLTDLQPRHLRHHVHQHSVLHHVPVVGRQHILAALVQDSVQRMAGDVEGHGVGAGVQCHLVQILKIVDIRQDAAAGRVVLQVVQHPVHLVHLPLGILMLHRQLIAVGLADGAVLIGPAVPDMPAEIMDVVGLLLPYPQQLVDTRLEVRSADGEDGELLAQVVTIYDAEFFDGVGGRTVLPVGAHVLVGIPYAVGKDLPAVFLEYTVCVAHGGVLLCDFFYCSTG